MSVAHQIVDVLISGVIAGLSAFVLSAAAPRFAVTIGVILASMYYFSRNPWGPKTATHSIAESTTSTNGICRFEWVAGLCRGGCDRGAVAAAGGAAARRTAAVRCCGAVLGG